MKRKSKKFLLIGLISMFAVAFGIAFTGCKKVNFDILPEEGLYEYPFNEPFTATPDSYMNLDGKFDEPIWEGKNWLESSVKNTSMRVTTAFTSEGLYIGVEVFDTNITWIGRNNFRETGIEKTNSFFMIQVIHSGQQQTNDRTKDIMLYMDCKSVCSHRERKIAAGSFLDGEANSGETKSLSGEIFVPWTELSYSENKTNEFGYPENIQMNVKYLRVFEGASGNNYTVKSSPLQLYTFTSYPYYNENGFMGTYDCDEFGGAIGGAPATDQWKIEKNSEEHVQKLTSQVDRMQVIFFRKDSEGNTKSFASDFILETRVRVLPLGSGSVPVCGLWIGSYLVTGVRGDQLYRKSLMIQNSKSISDMQWMGETWDYTIKDTVENNYDKDYVDLRIVKRGSEIYYFYNNTFFKVETRDNFAGSVAVGLFANGRAEFTNFRFIDYSDDVNGLTEYLSDFVYFINIQKGGAKGSISSEVFAVKKGDSITLNVQPSAECYLSEFKVNGRTEFEDLESGVDQDSGTYVYTPVENVDIEYKFDYFNSSDLLNSTIRIIDSTGAGLVNVSCRLKSGNNKLVYYNIASNDRGYLQLSLPRQGLQVGSVEIDGKFELYLKKDGKKPKKIQIDISEELPEILTMEDVGYGSLILNGLQTKDVTGTLLYDIDKDVYYVSGRNVVQYYKDCVSNKENNYNYVVNAEINVTPMVDGNNLNDETNGVSGIIISSGGEGSIVLKQTGYSWERNRLCLQLGTGVNDELSIGGFNHSLGSKGGTIKITVVRYNEAIYVFDKEGDIGFYLDAEGVHLVGDHQLKSNQLSRLPAINNKIKAFFARGGENAVGMINFDYVRAEWTKVKMDKGSIAAAEALRLYAIDFECETQDYSAHIEGIKSGEKYIGIAPVKIVFEMKNDRCPIEINVNSNGASTMVRGKVKGFVTEFEIKVVDDCAVTVSDYAQKNIYSGNIVGATTQAVLELYDEDGEFVGKDEEIFDEQGNYSLTLLGDKYSVIVMEADKAAFIDDLSSCADAALKFIPIITGEAYAERKDCEDGEWSSNDSRVKEYKLTNMASNADYEYNFSIVSGVAGDLYGEAALQLSVNIDKVVYMLYIGRMRSSGDNPLVLRFYKNGIEQSRCYNFVYSYNGKKGDSSFGSHFSDGLNQTYKISRVGREIIISMGKMDAGVASYRPMFRITANGMDFADDGLTIVSKHNLNNADLKEICKALCSENATHEFSLYTVTLTSWLLSAKKVETEKWECNVVSAANGSAMVDLYNEDGNVLTSCVAFVSDEKIAMLLDKKILSSAKKAIISQSNKIGFIDDLAADESVTMVDALTVTGDTYAERKDSSDGSWTYNDSKARIFNFKNMSSATDYEYTFSIVSAAAGDSVGEAALEISVGEYMLYIGRTRYAGNNPLVLRFYKNGEEQSRCYNFIYSYNGKTGDSSFGSHFSGGLNQTYKVSRAGREIIISMGNVDNGVASYHPMFRITENGMEFADEGLSIVSSHNLDNADLKNICKALCAEKATHNFALYTVTLTGWQLTAEKFSA